MAASSTPLGEAVEQTAQGMSDWCRDVADLFQTDIDMMASGQYGMTRLASCGLRLLRVNVEHLLNMSGVMADNMALLTADTSTSVQAPPSRRVIVGLPPAADASVLVVSSSLTGVLTGSAIPVACLSVGLGMTLPPNPVLVAAVTVQTAGVKADVYEGTITAMDGNTVVASVPYEVVIDEVNF